VQPQGSLCYSPEAHLDRFCENYLIPSWCGVSVLLMIASRIQEILSCCLFTGIAGLAAVACKNEMGCANADTRKPLPIKELTWKYEESPFGPTEVVVVVPKSASPTRRMPVLIALHGQGESRKPPAVGARGWPDDYGMERALFRLASPPLTESDFGGMINNDRLALFNESLEQRPYRGVIVVCPYLPDHFGQDLMFDRAAAYGDFLIKTVLPRVYKETPALGTPAATGIDGVSLGGRVSVLVGLGHPEVFGAVGGIQPAFGLHHVDAIADLVKQARTKRPELRFRLLSSKRDRFLDVTRALSKALKKIGQPHQVDIVVGDHSYEFNRGPGVFEMLLYYDRILRGEPFW
jgi:enterochelin esterase-like enzyme